MSKRKLTDQEIDKVVHVIAESVFKFMRKKFNREMDYIYKKNDSPYMEDLFNIIIMTLANVDSNFMCMSKKIFSNLDLTLAMEAHAEYMRITIENIRKEEMN